MRLLNVGCGEETYGTDFIDRYPSRAEVKKCDINKERLPYPNNSFDIVYSKNVFEHLYNKVFALKEMKRVLKKNGKLILITDNASCFVFSLDNTAHLGQYEKDHRDRPKDTHYSIFTSLHLENYFRLIGIKVENIKYENDTKNTSIATKIAKNILKFLLKLTPFWRMSYEFIRIEGRKL
jgi:ubiquinone/menaquinone biosynthesis C-methylase UbiE